MKCLDVQVRLGGGSVRINVFPDASTALPKLDIELFHFFGRINMYVNLVPRANLVRDLSKFSCVACLLACACCKTLRP